ncbi:MAG: hypothetical protein HQ478_03545 [Chloroflexi bacterium]|nr:hypothetical protein [Chloroflexota bacterium]
MTTMDNNADSPAAATGLRRITGRLSLGAGLPARFLQKPVTILAFGVVLFGIVGTLYFFASEDLKEVEVMLEENRLILAQGRPDLSNLQATLDGWQWSRDLALDNRVEKRFDSGLLDEIFQIAEVAGVDIFSSGIREESIAPILDAQYRSTPIFVKARGDLGPIEYFMFLLESGALVTSEIVKTLVSEDSGQFLIEAELNSLSEFAYNGPVDASDKSTTAPGQTSAAKK